MAAINRAYTSEYTAFEYTTLGQVYQPGQWAYPLPEERPAAPRVKRTRQRPALEPEAPKTSRALITHKMLRRTILLLVFMGAIVISTIWMSAKATEIKYEINQIKSENVLLQNEISMLDIKIQSANSIEQIEDYATTELKMQYPKSQQCIYVEAGDSASGDLVARIKEKAYKE